ncbi:MAG TPA: DUF4386 domain-containing protein [Nocardioidaceae bacterium]|nr:DUF4386 domain-containing protein [Nocardioidaceae bacterium]
MSEQRTARIMGGWFLATFVFSVPALFFYEPVLNNANYILGSGADTRVAFGAVFEILSATAGIATAVVIFPIAKRVSESIALGYVATRILESTVIVMGLISLMSVVALRQDLTGTASADDSLVNVGRSLVAIHDQTFLLGPQFCAGLGNGILLGYLMWRSGLVPRPMALFGLVGGPLALVGGVGVLLGAWADPSTVLFLFTAAEIIWEFSLSVYLLVRGFRPSPILTGPPVVPKQPA